MAQQPYAVALNPRTDIVHVAVAGTVVVINGQTSKVIHRITAWVQDAFWLALDPRTNTPVRHE